MLKLLSCSNDKNVIFYSPEYRLKVKAFLINFTEYTQCNIHHLIKLFDFCHIIYLHINYKNKIDFDHFEGQPNKIYNISCDVSSIRYVDIFRLSYNYT